MLASIAYRFIIARDSTLSGMLHTCVRGGIRPLLCPNAHTCAITISSLNNERFMPIDTLTCIIHWPEFMIHRILAHRHHHHLCVDPLSAPPLISPLLSLSLSPGARRWVLRSAEASLLDSPAQAHGHRARLLPEVDRARLLERDRAHHAQQQYGNFNLRKFEKSGAI